MYVTSINKTTAGVWHGINSTGIKLKKNKGSEKERRDDD